MLDPPDAPSVAVASPVLVAGLPKTGTTALGAVLHAAAGGAMATEPTSMARATSVPDCRVAKVVYPAHEQRTLTAFMQEFAECRRRIWIHRDPRDQLVSCFLYTWFRGHRMPEDRFRTALSLVRAREGGERIPFSEILERTFGPRTFYHDPAYHLDRVLPFFVHGRPSNVFLFAYDDLIAGRFGALSEYTGLSLAPAEVRPEHARVARSRASGEWRVATLVRAGRPGPAPTDARTLHGPHGLRG